MGVITAVNDSLPSIAGGAAPLLDGSYKVGVDISAGSRWHTDGPRTVHTYGEVQKASQCAWRLGWPEGKAGVTGVMETVVHNDDSGPADVMIGPEGATFETKGCKAWRRR